jgi:hypothetical protein
MYLFVTKIDKIGKFKRTVMTKISSSVSIYKGLGFRFATTVQLQA